MKIHFTEDCIFLHTFDSTIAKRFDLETNSINLIFPEIYRSDYEKTKKSFTKVKFIGVKEWVDHVKDGSIEKFEEKGSDWSKQRKIRTRVHKGGL